MNDVIESLKKLDLATFPENEIKELLGSMGPVAFMVAEFHHPKTIERAVPNNEQELVFSNVARISFKPSKYNNSFQRASTPSNTMFYGSIIPENVSDEEIYNSRIIGASETCDLLRNKSITQGERTITFGKWEVQETLSLITIIDLSRTYNIRFLNDQLDHYKKSLEPYDLDVKKTAEEYSSFFASEFAKPVNDGEHHNYMISALFTEKITQLGFDGVLYPSVQTGGNGLCVAIHPNAMHKLRIVKVLQCQLVKEGKEILMTNLRYCNVDPGAEEFQLQIVEED